jgi:hypothetical protein
MPTSRTLQKVLSVFVRGAFRDAARLVTQEKERRHRLGYEAKPVQRGELDDWTPEQAWP